MSTDDQVRIGLAILNRNEAEALPRILPRIVTSSVDVVFAVDGNSTDRSPTMIQEAGFEVLTQKAPGRGEAFRLAFEHAGRLGLGALIFFSPDGNEDPGDIPRFREGLAAGADMVIASRMMEAAFNEEDVSWFRPRKWANLGFNWLAYLTWGRGQRRITDGINGYRAITSNAWELMRPDGFGYTIEYQTTIRAYKSRLKVVEFPTREGQRLGGQSNATAVDTGLRFMRLFVSELRIRKG